MTRPVADVVERIDESAWTKIDAYPDSGEAQVAETTLSGRRLIVRRVRTLDADQGELFATWQHFPFVTNRSDDIALVEAEHRQHAVVELVIRDLKDQALAHFPSGEFHANGAWTVIACLAHNLLRWTETIGLGARAVRAARTVRRRLLALPGRLTRHAGRWTLHLPARWPWQHDFTEALARIRAPPTPADPDRPSPQHRRSVSPTGRDHARTPENVSAGTHAPTPRPPTRPTTAPATRPTPLHADQTHRRTGAVDSGSDQSRRLGAGGEERR